MRRWKIIGIIATLIIVVSLPLYGIKQKKNQSLENVVQEATFITSKACAKCHKKEYEEWQDSHHAKAMAVATDETVLADFNNTIFEKDGVQSRFFRKDGGFFVYTRGPKGEMADFEITHTFGYSPLQQYLIPFPGGKMQCLPIAWDVKENKWFHLYPDLTLDPEEWIYWTNQGQNWNSMCADCHSTELQKNYDPKTESYNTSWAEINVGCEACHGPGSKHLAWAELPEMARPENDGLLVQTSGINNRQQVESCAPCHSRRSMLGDYKHEQQDLLDTEVPRLFEERLYYPDGQILDEVYVYGSFVQSKMYANDVRCSDCHNVHTIKLHQEGNALCSQCHQASVYDNETHHFHKQKGEKGDAIRGSDNEVLFKVGSGAECVQCHMPGRVYMGNDYRPDHSIRVPRPDLSTNLGTPNACNRCHIDKSNEWSAEYTQKWYGSKQKYHYGTVFFAARQGEAQAFQGLKQIIQDALSPLIVRATALSYLNRYPTDSTLPLFKESLISDEALLRRTTLMNLPPVSAEDLQQLVSPLLTDPVKGVRIEAARTLAKIPADQISEKWRKPYDSAIAEYMQTALYSADFAASRLNLGALATLQGQTDEAEEHFKKAITIDRDLYSARTNLAILYSRHGKLDLAEEVLQKTLAVNPVLADVHYSLGLLLSEKKQYSEAVKHLQTASSGMPDNAKTHYNLGQLLLFLQRDTEAGEFLKKSFEIEPQNENYQQAVVRFYVEKGDLQQVKEIAEKIIAADKADPFGHQILEFLKSRQQ
ncbi:MAG: tetratricopeptide repeat protein [Deltaproteobacteria bacterium]|nr:tetratricopeptide repeat protein [Deltaproteobacteria bacterium]